MAESLNLLNAAKVSIF